eukprot:jgi/Mesvir1/23482/Mv22330-RA.1
MACVAAARYFVVSEAGALRPRAWLEKCVPDSRCPKCNALLQSSVEPLRVANPLAWRVLSRVRVKCPVQLGNANHVENCRWQGDYSDLGAHLTSSESHVPGAARRGAGAADGASRGGPDSHLREAESLKDHGNQLFQQRSYQDAIKLYSKAIALAPASAAAPSYYANRAAAWLMLGALKECISDCRQAVTLNPTYTKGWVRLAKALSEMGAFSEAEAELRAAMDSLMATASHSSESAPAGSEMFPQDAPCVEEGEEGGGDGAGMDADARLSARVAELRQAYLHTRRMREGYEAAVGACRAGLFAEAREAMVPVLKKHGGCVPALLWAARADVGCGDVTMAIRRTLDVLRADAQCVDAYVVRGIALLAAGTDLDLAVRTLKGGLQLDPDNAEATKSARLARKLIELVAEARDAAFGRAFERSVEKWAEALAVAQTHTVESWQLVPPKAPLLATIYAERAKCHLRLQALDVCLADCSAALGVMEDCKDAWLTRASALEKSGRREQAREELSALLQEGGMFQHDRQVVSALERREFEIRKQKRPDLYAILGVSCVASEAEIKAGYKTKALECHPDKAPPERRKEAEEMFKDLGVALEILGDSMKRKLWDEGYDKEAIEERVVAMQRAAKEGNPHHHGHRRS